MKLTIIQGKFKYKNIYSLINSMLYSFFFYLNRLTLKVINKQKWNELLTCIRLILDISYAVNYLPSGILWAGQLKTWHIGLLGSLSSLIGLYQTFNKQAKHKNF